MSDKARREVVGSTSYSTGVLFGVATRAYERTRTSASTTDVMRDALVATVFAAATLEAFIMQLADAGGVRFDHPDDTRIKSFAEVVDELEAARASTRLKYWLGLTLLAGQPVSKGALPYQDLDLLFRIRDAIIHLKPERITGEPHPIVAQMEARGILPRGTPPGVESWLSRVATPPVARWACNVVPAVVGAFRQAFPVDDPQLPPTLLHSLVWGLGYDPVS